MKPYPFQQDTIGLAMSQNLLMNFSCGLGKTFTAIEIAKVYLYHPDRPQNIGGVLVVCPRRLRVQWISMIREHDPDAQITIGEIGYRFDPRKVNGWLITHYEALVRDADVYAGRYWACVIADEAHYIKNRKAKRTEAIMKLVAARKLALTATPMDRSPAELWSILKWLDPNRIPSYWTWVGEYCVFEDMPPWLTRGHEGIRKIAGAKNLEGLARLTSDMFIRFTKEQVAPQLPPKTYQYVPIEMEAAQAKIYNQILHADDIVVSAGDVELVVSTVLAKLIKLLQVSSNPAAYHWPDVSSGKVEWLWEYLDNNPEEPIVVFTRFRATAQFLAARLKCDLVIGQSTTYPHRFISGEHRVVVGTIGAMGTGIDGLQRADTAIFVEQEWSTTLMQQAEDRIHRLGITQPKNIIHLYSAGTKDELVLKALEKKWSEQILVYEYLREEGHLKE